MTADQINALARLDPEVWWTLYGAIKLKEGGKPKIGGLRPNIVQKKMFAAYREDIGSGRPCRMLVLKPRKTGASTGAQGIAYHHLMSHPELNGAIMGDIAGTSGTMFDIFRAYVENDRFQWGYGPADLKKLLADTMTLPSGSCYWRETAGSSNAGRSGTVQVANATEVAHFPRSETKDPALGFLNSWADATEASLGILDTTPNGPQGLFFDLWSAKGNGWRKIFAAWFEFAEHFREFGSADERSEFGAGLNEDEKEEMMRYGVTLEQLLWRRDTISNKCQGDDDKFRQEYPSNDVECFLRSSRLRFKPVQVAAMVAAAGRGAVTEKGEVVMGNDQAVSFVTGEDGTVEVWERPRVGCRYLVSMDTCTGEDQQQGGPRADPDYHSIGVWRAGYVEEGTGTVFAPRQAAHHWSRLDVDLAALVAAGLSIMYGRCEVVPEVNNCGLVVVKRLEEWGIPVFYRQHTNRTAGTVDRFAGWKTDAVTRKTILDNLAAAVREWKPEKPTFELGDGWILEQMGKFVVNKDGRSEAMPGAHDDGVMQVAIGLANLSRATLMREVKRKKVNLEKLMRQQGWRRTV